MKIHPPIARIPAVRTLGWRLISGPEALEAGSGFDQRTVHAEVIVTEQVQSRGLAHHFVKECAAYFNGHSFGAQELTRAGVRFRKADYAFLGVTDVAALQAAADRLSAAILQRRCAYWVRRLVPVFSPAEHAALQPGYRYGMAQMELATDIVFKRTAPLKALFQRACELGVLVGGAERTTHLFGRRIHRRYQGKLHYGRHCVDPCTDG